MSRWASAARLRSASRRKRGSYAMPYWGSETGPTSPRSSPPTITNRRAGRGVARATREPGRLVTLPTPTNTDQQGPTSKRPAASWRRATPRHRTGRARAGGVVAPGTVHEPHGAGRRRSWGQGPPLALGDLEVEVEVEVGHVVRVLVELRHGVERGRVPRVKPEAEGHGAILAPMRLRM